MALALAGRARPPGCQSAARTTTRDSRVTPSVSLYDSRCLCRAWGTAVHQMLTPMTGCPGTNMRLCGLGVGCVWMNMVRTRPAVPMRRRERAGGRADGAGSAGWRRQVGDRGGMYCQDRPGSSDQVALDSS